MSKLAVHEAMNLGHAARKAGRSGEALDHFRTALTRDPASAEANSAYGLMLLSLGRAEESESPLRQALDSDPANTTYRMNFAQLLALRGKVDEAVQMVTGIVADEPQAWWAWDRLGEFEVRRRNFGGAAENYGRAAGLRPEDPSLHFKWARATFDSGRVDAAERILRDAAKLVPEQEAIYRLGCEIFEAQANWDTLECLAGAWTQSHPKSPGAWRSLAKAQLETGLLRQAMRNFRTSLDLAGHDAAGLAIFGRLCLSALEFENAAKALDESEALDPKNSQMLSGQAVRLMLSGRYDEAKAYCRRSLAVNKDDAAAYKALVQLSDGRLRPDDFEALQVLAGREDIPVEDRITAAYALADCQDARGEFDQAFVNYERANRISIERSELEGLRYDRSARKQQVDELISLFAWAPPPAATGTGATPVFIVGMPRSGTTLIESVIGAHSRAFACGERAAARWIMQDFLANARKLGPTGIPDGTWAQWRELYWKELPDIKGAAVVTDKNPWNFDAIGLILQLFPDARIIHVRRDAVETGLSIYRNEFTKFQSFANRLADIGHYYGEYARLMAHWEGVLGDRFTTIQYEDFVAQFEVAGPALLAACGLDWEDSCRDYWKSSRTIGTISSLQARQPLKQAGGRAQSYASHLGPLITELKAAGVDPRPATGQPA